MYIQVGKERAAMERQWKQRETQLEIIMKSTVGMYGEMKGLIGKSLPEIKKLELDAGDDDKRMLTEGD
jgi:hypothetical protein